MIGMTYSIKDPYAEYEQNAMQSLYASALAGKIPIESLAAEAEALKRKKKQLDSMYKLRGPMSFGEGVGGSFYPNYSSPFQLKNNSSNRSFFNYSPFQNQMASQQTNQEQPTVPSTAMSSGGLERMLQF